MKFNLAFLLVAGPALVSALIPDNGRAAGCVDTVPAGGNPTKVCPFLIPLHFHLHFHLHMKWYWPLLTTVSNITSQQYNICREHPLGHSLAARKPAAAQAAVAGRGEAQTLSIAEAPAGEIKVSIFQPSQSATHLAFLTSLNIQVRGEHPLGRAPEAPVDTRSNTSPPTYLGSLSTHAINQANACWFGAYLGCNKSYCYSRCGATPGLGWWCWLAENYGKGNWATCHFDPDCERKSPTLGCGGTCSC
jgi:hypothetical protein